MRGMHHQERGVLLELDVESLAEEVPPKLSCPAPFLPTSGHPCLVAVEERSRDLLPTLRHGAGRRVSNAGRSGAAMKQVWCASGYSSTSVSCLAV